MKARDACNPVAARLKLYAAAVENYVQNQTGKAADCTSDTEEDKAVEEFRRTVIVSLGFGRPAKENQIRKPDASESAPDKHKKWTAVH